MKNLILVAVFLVTAIANAKTNTTEKLEGTQVIKMYDFLQKFVPGDRSSAVQRAALDASSAMSAHANLRLAELQTVDEKLLKPLREGLERAKAQAENSRQLAVKLKERDDFIAQNPDLVRYLRDKDNDLDKIWNNFALTNLVKEEDLDAKSRIQALLSSLRADDYVKAELRRARTAPKRAAVSPAEMRDYQATMADITDAADSNGGRIVEKED